MLHEINTPYSVETIYAKSPIGDRMAKLNNPVFEWLGLALGAVWCEFEEKLSTIDIVQKIESKHLSLVEYQSYLLNMRQQVKEGARWISRAASSMDDSHTPLRNALIAHSAAEHKDFTMLEQDYVKVGGALSTIQTAEKNIGSEALHAYIFAQSSQTNPVHAFGATFIIEGMGTKKAGLWAHCISKALSLPIEDISFLYYHGKADEDHYENLLKVLTSPFITEEVAVRMVKCAKVVARLYALQLEELDNC
ncbi:hypothetical protein [uncultured Shewanella sp.]|uniref:hypothetical protein n=1 Tax=uncultured Shewanella sp. TaxID=173975 RepID=UPI00261E2F06|nr:hypothetical protein [uncultured Shewanella sp.]